MSETGWPSIYPALSRSLRMDPVELDFYASKVETRPFPDLLAPSSVMERSLVVMS